MVYGGKREDESSDAKWSFPSMDIIYTVIPEELQVRSQRILRG